MISRTQEVGVPIQAGTSHFVIVTLWDRFFAIDAAAVRGIVDAPERVESLAPEFQGDVYQVIDLARRLATRDTQAQRLGQLVLLGLEQRRGSVGVVRVHGRMDLHASQILSLPPHFQGAERDWYRGMILFENSVVLILNLSWVFHGAHEVQQNSPRPTSAAGPEGPGVTC